MTVCCFLAAPLSARYENAAPVAVLLQGTQSWQQRTGEQVSSGACARFAARQQQQRWEAQALALFWQQAVEVFEGFKGGGGSARLCNRPAASR